MKILAVLVLVFSLALGMAAPVLAVSLGPPELDVDGAIGQLEAITTEINVMSMRVGIIVPSEDNLGPMDVNGAVGQLSAMATELGIVRSRIVAIEDASQLWTEGGVGPQLIDVHAAAANLQDVSRPPNPCDLAVASALNVVGNLAGQILALVPGS